MRKYIFIAAAALLGTLGLAACSNSGTGGQQAATQAKTTRPSSADVDNAIKDCQSKHPKPAAAPASAGTAPSMAQDDTEDPCARATVSASTWQSYLQQVVGANMGDITNTPYAYFVPSGKYPENAGAVSRVQDSLSTVVAATVLPGNLIAVGGPDSATSAQLLEGAFKQASPGSFKGVTVLFIGDQADLAAVKAAVDPSGATVKFAQM